MKVVSDDPAIAEVRLASLAALEQRAATRANQAACIGVGRHRQGAGNDQAARRQQKKASATVVTVSTVIAPAAPSRARRHHGTQGEHAVSSHSCDLARSVSRRRGPIRDRRSRGCARQHVLQPYVAAGPSHQYRGAPARFDSTSTSSDGSSRRRRRQVRYHADKAVNAPPALRVRSASQSARAIPRRAIRCREHAAPEGAPVALGEAALADDCSVALRDAAGRAL